MDDERDERLREEWAEDPQTAFLAAAADLDHIRGGRGPETPAERAAREGAPAVEGPSLDELLEREPPPATTSFTAGAFEEHEKHAHGDDAPDEG